jgi:hypothetical protein
MMTATSRPGFTYTWQGPNGFTSNVSTPSIANFASQNIGTYTVVFNSLGCGAASRSISIRGNDPALVVASNSGPACVNGVVYFSGTAPSGSTYQWSGPSGFTSTQQSPSRSRVQTHHSGVYTLTAQVAGCGSVTTTTTVTVNVCRDAEDFNPASIIPSEQVAGATDHSVSGKVDVEQSEGAYTLTIWPNPNDGSVMHLGWSGLGIKDRDITVKIYDALGKMVQIKSLLRNPELSSDFEASIEFDLPLAKGIYSIESIYDGIRKYERLIVE